MSAKHWVDVRDKPAFLHRLMRELAGDARLSLEGDLRACSFDTEEIAAHDELGLLQRNTLSPRVDFVVLHLVPSRVGSIFSKVSAVGFSDAIIHVQIERAGILELGAYDNFHSQCVVTGPGVSSALLSDLKVKNVIRAFGAADVESATT